MALLEHPTECLVTMPRARGGVQGRVEVDLAFLFFSPAHLDEVDAGAEAVHEAARARRTVPPPAHMAVGHRSAPQLG